MNNKKEYKNRCERCWNGEIVSNFDESTLANISICDNCSYKEITGFGRLHIH